MAAGRDQLVPLRQSCVVAAVRRAAGHTVAEVRQMQDGQPGDLHGPAGRRCPGAALAHLPELAGQDVLLVYEDLGHTSTPLMWKMAERYLAANLRLTR